MVAIIDKIVHDVRCGCSRTICRDAGTQQEPTLLATSKRVDPEHDHSEVAVGNLARGLEVQLEVLVKSAQTYVHARFVRLRNGEIDIRMARFKALKHSLARGILAWKPDEHQIAREVLFDVLADRNAENSPSRYMSYHLRDLDRSP